MPGIDRRSCIGRKDKLWYEERAVHTNDEIFILDTFHNWGKKNI